MEIDSTSLDYQAFGHRKAPHLLLLHAGALTRREWDPFVEAWAAHYHVITPTALGHGASPASPTISLESMAQAMVGLLDRLGVQKAHVVGSSMGGATALRIALRHPDRLERMVLYRTGYRIGPSMRDGLESFASEENWRRWGMESWMSREHEPQGGPEAWKTVIRRVSSVFDPERKGVSLGLTDLANLPHPTLLISGDRDHLVPLADVMEMFHAIPQAQLWIVPGSGHVMGMETWRRPAFVQEVLRFLRRR